MTTPAGKRWEHFPHGADVGARGVAPTLEQAFEQAALALSAAVVAEPETLHTGDSVQVSCESPNRELLLVDWLNALIYHMATRRLVFGRFEVALNDSGLEATAWGESFDAKARELVVEPKGATYTALSVRLSHRGAAERRRNACG